VALDIGVLSFIGGIFAREPGETYELAHTRIYRCNMIAMRVRLLACLTLACCLEALGANFRWATQGDASSLDPHAQNENLTNQINAMVYEQLLQYDKDMKLVPWLATSWENPGPDKWIFHLRRDVKFHDGTPFTADDVVFSFERVRTTVASFRIYGADSGVARRIDDHTVEFTTPSPNPVETGTVASIFIMSRKWCEKNNCVRPQDITAKEETFSARNAMVTGPYILTGREAGVMTTHRRNPDWWGLEEGRFEGNAETIEYRQITNAATRMAALKSGELDFVLDPPMQDIARLRDDASLKVWEGFETRVIFLGFDQARDELLYSNVKGRNPFKDRRVRQALWQAIDTQALKSQVMRGLSIPTAIALPDPAGSGLPDSMEKRPAYDPAAAKRLLADAGYPNGFGFTLTCPNNRYINDEKICIALAAMWARAGQRLAGRDLHAEAGAPQPQHGRCGHQQPRRLSKRRARPAHRRGRDGDGREEAPGDDQPRHRDRAGRGARDPAASPGDSLAITRGRERRPPAQQHALPAVGEGAVRDS
jgi:peptide/nickel transport system substrate-binding protein